MRDLAYDIENWKISWEHLGGLLPVIGVIKNVVKVSKAGDVFAIVKIGDKVFEFRRLGSISDILTESGSKYIRNELAFAGSPGYAMDIMGSELYGDILKSCENMDEYKYLYNNPVLEAFQKNADDVKYLKEKNPGKLDDIIEDACNSGIKNADDLENFTAEALEAANKSSTSTLAQYGDDFGKMGTYVENPNIKVDWTQYIEHAAERMQQRGMTQEIVNNIVENGKVLSQNNGNKFAYITQEGVAIVSKEGKLITAWSSADFDSSMLEIISKLFGE